MTAGGDLAERTPAERTPAGRAAAERAERALVWLDLLAGAILVAGALGAAVYWRLEMGRIGRLRGFWLHTAASLGLALLVAWWSHRRRWRARWLVQMLPLGVPVVAAYWLIARFVVPLLGR